MRISDWSSDVCSSDLGAEPCLAADQRQRPGEGAALHAGGVWRHRAAREPRRLQRASARRRGHRGRRRELQLLQPAEWSAERSEEHTSELQSLMRISYAVFCLKKKKNT